MSSSVRSQTLDASAVRPGIVPASENPSEADGCWSKAFGIPGTNGGVHALAVYQDELIAAGHFDRVNGVEAANIARWDGVRWAPLGEGIEGRVLDLAGFAGDLVATGQITGAGGSPARHAVRRDGARWAPVGDGVHPIPLETRVNDLIEYQGGLILAGSFFGAGETSDVNIVCWNGTEYRPLGTGGGGIEDGWVQALAFHDGELVIGGEFDGAGDLEADDVIRWDGHAFRPIGPGGPRYAYALAAHQGYLYVGGINNQGGGSSGASIRRWDGEGWQSLPSADTYWVEALLSAGNALYAGGNFDRVGDRLPSYRIAAWTDAEPVGAPLPPAGGDPTAAVPLRLQVLGPRPAAGPIRLAYAVARPGPVTLTLHDVHGRRIATLLEEPSFAGSAEMTWRPSNARGDPLPAGAYWLRLRAGGAARSVPVLILR